MIGDQNLPGVLTFFRGKPDDPRKVKRYCRPEVGGRESGPGNVTDLLHREARLLWQQGSLSGLRGGRVSAGLLQMIGVSGAGRACMPSSRADHATLVVGQLKEGESCSLLQEGEARSPK